MTSPHPDARIPERYVRLAHGIEAHVPGFIDGYGGPQDWKTPQVSGAADLRAEADDLLGVVSAEPDPERRAFLQAQIRAMQTMTRLISGEHLDYAAEVRGLFDIEPPRVPESVFEGALRELDRTLPGSGSLAAREAALRERLRLRHEQILPLAQTIVAELRGRTARMFPLPQGEDFSVHLVQNKPWGGYNWPLGHYRSRIDINTDLPTLLTALPDLMAHEGYPGHHTEHAIKEAALAEQRGWQEFKIQLINAPECVVSEGIATRALGTLMAPEEVRRWLTEELAPLAGIDPEAVAISLESDRLRAQLAGVPGNAALMLHEQGADTAALLDYFQTYGLRSPEQAQKNLEFISLPSTRGYIFTYSVGGQLLDDLFGHEDRTEAFRWLLTRPVTPGLIRERLQRA